MAGVVADSGVEDIMQSVSAEKQVADYSHAVPYFRVCPQPTEIGYCVYYLFFLFHFPHKLLVGYLMPRQQHFNLLLVALNKRNYALSEVLRDVFRLVFDPAFYPFPHFFFKAILVVKMIAKGRVLLLLLIDLIEDIIAMLERGVAFKDFSDIRLMDGVVLSVDVYFFFWEGGVGEGLMIFFIGLGRSQMFKLEFIKVNHKGTYILLIIQIQSTFALTLQGTYLLLIIIEYFSCSNFKSIYNSHYMTEKLTQSQINALLEDSDFEQSSLRQSKPVVNNSKNNFQKSREDTDQYGGQDFESFEESRNSYRKNKLKNQPLEVRKSVQLKKKLTQIKQQQAQSAKKSKSNQKSIQKPKPKTGISFYPPKQSKNLPYNYNRLQERQKQLLLTTIMEENKRLKESLKYKDDECKKIEAAYRNLLTEKSQQVNSVREATLVKQNKVLQQKYDKLQHLLKIEKERTTFKSKDTNMKFIPQTVSDQREQELLNIIDKLKERLLSTNTQLKTLQTKMNEGENYIDELKRKMKRVEQLEYKMDKMAQQAENDREIIKNLQSRNAKLDSEVHQLQKQRRLLEVQIRRYELGNETQNDLIKELQQTRKQKQLLQKNLRDLAGNISNLSKNTTRQIQHIQDSGQLLRPK